MTGIVVSEMSGPRDTDKTRWAVKPYSWNEASTLATDLQIPLVAAIVLCTRGLGGPRAAREFIQGKSALPDPFLFGDMQGAVGVLGNAIDRSQKIVVHGDYDADGITATATMVMGLRALGGDVHWYLPSRFEEGYGLSRQAVESIAGDGGRVLVAVDCGVNYPDEVAFGRELGMEVVVVDHHEPGAVLPDCPLIHRVRGEYPDGELCGVGLALKVLHGLHIEREDASRERLPEGLRGFLDLVAVGTIADLVDLRGENREYVREGLRLLNTGQRVGFRALAEVSSCAGAIDSGAVAFRIAPRLNAAGRLGDPAAPLRLLLCEDDHEARVLARELHELNSTRQELERKGFAEADERMSRLTELPEAIVLADERWHEGVVGIVASRMVERYHRPTVLLAAKEGVAKGSGRSISGYDLFAGLRECEHLLQAYGGHAQAAGLTLDESAVEALSSCLCSDVRNRLGSDGLTPRYLADAVITSDELNMETARILESLEPFGSGNPRPRVLLPHSMVRNAQATRNGLHLRCELDAAGIKVPAVGFGMGSRTDLSEGEGKNVVVGGQLRTDEWQGRARLQVLLERVDEASDVSGSGRDGHCARAVGYTGEAVGEEGEGCRRWKGILDSKVLSALPSWPLPVRDLRDRPGPMAAVAQLAASGEGALIATCDVGDAWREVMRTVPGCLLEGGVGCLARAADWERGKSGDSRLWVADWEALVACGCGALDSWDHVVVNMPPFKLEHLEWAVAAGEAGATVHLAYGATERASALARLRYVAHPRFAMVCLYRAMASDGQEASQVYELARDLAWDEAGVSLSGGDLERASNILEELGLDRSNAGKAKLEARRSSLYREAEAEYEECVRLCRSA